MSQFQKFAVAFDLHGDKQDRKSVATFNGFLAAWKPDLRIFDGDLWDLRPLRRKANDEERRESLKQDFEAGTTWLKDYHPNYFVRGNHDERLWDSALADNGVISDYCAEGVADIETICDSIGCKMLPYHKRDNVLKIGHLKVFHGFASGVYAVRQTALIYGSCLFGHVHDVTEHSIPGLERRVARSCGAMCSLDMDYAARTPNTLRQANGFAYGVINKRTGDYFSWQAESINGRWVIPTDYVVL